MGDSKATAEHRVVAALAAAGHTGASALELMDRCGIRTSRLYPILARLASDGRVTSYVRNGRSRFRLTGDRT